MRSRVAFSIVMLLVASLLALPASTSAQVATLRTPGPEAVAGEAPVEPIEGQEAILAFVGCLRENGLDIPDPQFGPEGVPPTDALRGSE